MKATSPKPKTCKVCKGKFMPYSAWQKACSPTCAISLVAKDNAKVLKRAGALARQEYRARRDKQKTRSDWLREAQAAFNAFVRTRDRHLPCISCRRFHQGQWHCGHFLSVGARPNLRFDPRNAHKQCQPCNTHLHGNLIEYRLGLIDRAGLPLVEALESDHTPRHYSIEDLKELKRNFTIRRRELEREHNETYSRSIG